MAQAAFDKALEIGWCICPVANLVFFKSDVGVDDVVVAGVAAAAVEICLAYLSVCLVRFPFGRPTH